MLRRVVVVLVLVSGAVGAGALAPVALAEGVCANEALRVELGSGGLPDCRAYEMVSPTFKSGNPVIPTFMSSDGSRVFVATRGAFAGTESQADGGVVSDYVLSRTGSGWVTSAVSPPASLFPVQKSWGTSADLGRTLWDLRRLSQSVLTGDLYVREADGSLAMVGPTVPPSVAAGPPGGLTPGSVNGVYEAGASGDLSHVLFNSDYPGARWPGDTTVKGPSNISLYEYVGTGNTQPDLVGVNGEGRLVSDCGTDLGAAEGQDVYNALSANGEAVFFTARATSVGPEGKFCRQGNSGPEGSGPSVDEVYARLGQIETVAISEPSARQCEQCRTEVKSSAVFQGASEDGSKAFFLTEQELLAGDTTQNLYEYDFNNPEGRQIVRVSSGSATPEVLGVARVSLDGSHVYFVAKGVLTAGANAEGAAPAPGAANLYVFERDAGHPGGHLTFVATLSEEDSGDWGQRDYRQVQATPDGRFLVFQSVADLTPGDTSGQPQVFEYDAQREELGRVSVAAEGYPAGMASADTHGSFITGPSFTQIAVPPTLRPSLAVSDDGSRVVFTSAAALTSGAEEAAAAGAESVYEYRSAGSIANGDVHLISDGRNAASVTLVAMSASGGDVFFQTGDPLLAQDSDTQQDLYDARVDGGFPVPVTTRVCEGEACQGAAPGSASFAAPGSASARGGGNLSLPPPGSGVQPKTRPLTRAQQLASALRECRRKQKRERRVCETRARKRYRVRSNGRGKGGR